MTTTLIIGSVAMKRLLPETRTPKDLDVWSDQPMTESDRFWDDRLYQYLNKGESRHATLNELYTIKRSHIFWELRNSSWDKHIHDISVLKNAGAQLIPHLHDLLYPIWSDLHGRKVLNLEQESDDFFTDAVTRKYVHDSLHESVAYGNRPLYEQILTPGKTVAMNMKLLRDMPFEEQVKLFREEIYVTALERIIIPNDYKYSPTRAYRWALRRTITGLTKGWSAQFLVDNYETFRKPDIDYVRKHLDNKHVLKPLEQENH